MARHLRGDAGLRRLLLWPQVGRVWLGRCLARLPMSRARTSPMAGSLASRRQAEGARWAPGTGVFLTTAA